MVIYWLTIYSRISHIRNSLFSIIDYDILMLLRYVLIVQTKNNRFVLWPVFCWRANVIIQISLQKSIFFFFAIFEIFFEEEVSLWEKNSWETHFHQLLKNSIIILIDLSSFDIKYYNKKYQHWRKHNIPRRIYARLEINLVW